MTNIRRLQDVQIGTEELINTYRNYFANRYIDAAHNLINTNTLKSYVLQAEWMNSVKTKIEDLEQPKDTEIDQDLKNKNIEFQYNVDELLYLNEYNGNVQYYKNNFVLYNNRVYFCIQNSLGNLPTNTSYWLNVGLIGEKGQYGLGVTYKGFWNENTLYNKYDLVSYQNNLYIAINDNSGNVPSQYEKYLNDNLYLNDGLYLGYTESNQYWFLLTRVQPQPIYIFPLDYTQLPSYSIFLKELSHSIPSTPVSVSGSIISINNALSSPVVDLTVGIEPVQSGTGDPSPTNVRPISGWTGCNVQRTGKNLCCSTVHGYVDGGSQNRININNNSESAVFYAVAGKTYTISSSVEMNRSRLGKVASSDIYANMPLLDIELINDNSNTWVASWTGWTVWYKCNSSQSNFATSAQVELGSTATSYESYTGTTYPISWSTQAGTVYGGSLDVTTGVLTVNWRSVTLTGAEEEGWSINKTGTENWYYITANGILTALAKNNSDNMKTNLYPWASVVNASTDNGFWGSTSVGAFRVRWGEEDTVANWKNFLASNPLHVVYKTLEPLIYQLTPTEVMTLLGVNNIWADTGDMQMTYKANINS